MAAPSQFLMDTNVLDRIVDDGTAELVQRLHECGLVELLVTRVQEDEVADGPGARRKALTSVPRPVIPTRGFVLDQSRLDQARLGSEEVIEALRARRHRGTRDALVGANAEGERLAPVTDDARLRARAQAEPNVPVLSWADCITRSRRWQDKT